MTGYEHHKDKDYVLKLLPNLYQQNLEIFEQSFTMQAYEYPTNSFLPFHLSKTIARC